MNKQELIDAVAGETGLTKAAAEKSINSVFESIKKSLKKGKEVQLIGFGTFGVRKRKARVGRNPQTGATIQIKARKAVVFKAGKALKDVVA